ncbi:MAG TPA: antitoxin Xre-like helix-turn-helix domain-containing protein, partial [Candidatus Udaeobacter sp.]|nr:antitoxin Xre-like helix-turn-helix domain-containing protein [Candidatus Udaeobacter sp.]
MKTATLDKKTHGSKATHPTDLIRQIQKGLRFSELETLQNTLDLPFEKLAARLCISRSTLQRRKAAGRLSPEESDKVVRLSRLLEHATTVFGDVEKARAWLKHPQY